MTIGTEIATNPPVMKKTQLLGIAGLSLLAAGSAAAEVDSKFHLGYSTDYIFRGLNLSNGAGSDSGLFEYGLDFSGQCGGGLDWNAGVWVADYGNFAEETDFYASISKDMGCAAVELGFVRYDNNGWGGDTTELFLGASTEFSGLNVAAIVYYDVDALDGFSWGEITVGRAFEVAAGLTVDAEASIGTTLGEAGDEYVSYGLTLSTTKQINDDVALTAYIAGEITEGHAIDGDDLVGGASLSYSF